MPEYGENTQHTALSRRLTSKQVSMIGLSGALGTGLFLGSGSTIALGGPATVISYGLAGLLALSVVWALAEMVTVHPVPGGHGAGVWYWEPAWLPLPGSTWASEAARRYIGEEEKRGGNEWANQCLFDYTGRATPAIREFSAYGEVRA